MALWHVWQALLLWFSVSPPMSVDSIGRILGISGSSNGPLHQVLRCALNHEARLAQQLQTETTLRGMIEADGTSVRHFRSGNDLVYDQWFGMVERAPGDQRSRKILLFYIGGARAKALGKPPPESYGKIRASGAFSYVGRNPNGLKSCLLTDGAPCYPRVAKECSCKHFAVNHSAGEFERTERFRNKSLSVHTGTIDSCWKQMKMHIPKSLSSKHPEIPVRIRSWQWRFTNADRDDLFQLCAQQLAKLMR